MRPDDSADLTAPPPFAETVFGERIGGAVDFARMLASTGVEHGLIGPREVPRLWERHILNCAVVAGMLPPGAVVADIGSGAGLPGIALAIARPDLTVHLIEPLARRVAWLHGCLAELSLGNVTVHRARAEEIAGRVRADIVTARAVARLGVLASWSAPLCKPGGQLIAIKGVSAAREVSEDAAAISLAGGADPVVALLGEGSLEVPTTVVRMTFPSAGRRLPRGRQPARRVRRRGPKRA